VAERVLIDHAEYVIPVDGEGSVLADASTLIDGGRIEAVGWFDPPEVDRRIDGRGMLVTPGLVNAHFHVSAPSVAVRNFQTDTESSMSEMFDLGRAMGEEDAEAAALLGITELLLGGTTTFADPSETVRTGALVRAVERSGIRAVLGRYAVDVENEAEPAHPLPDTLRGQEEFAARWTGHAEGRVTTWISLLFGRTSSDQLLIESKRLSDVLGIPLTIHAGSSQREIDARLKATGHRPVEHLAEVGFLGPRTLLSHAIFVDDAELASLADSGTSVVFTPMTELRAAMGLGSHGRHPEMAGAGIRVGLGADGGDWGPVSVHRAMYLAAALFKDAREEETVVPAEDALEMATRNGAEGVGLPDVGGLRVGARADLVLWDTRRPGWRAMIDPVANFVYCADGGSVDTVIVDGRVVVSGHQPVYGDLESIIAAGEAAGRRAIAAVGTTHTRRWPMRTREGT
jgi:cytosine/adenosine deaminase-related metal-dependent hydrolase